MTSDSADRRWRELRKIAFANTRNPDRRLAAECWERVVEAKTADSVARFALGWIYTLLGEPQRALSHLCAVRSDAANFDRVRELRVRIARQALKRIEQQITPQNASRFSTLLLAIEPVLRKDPGFARVLAFSGLAEAASRDKPVTSKAKFGGPAAATKPEAGIRDVLETEPLELAHRLDDRAPDASRQELAEIRTRIYRLVPKHPALVHLLARYCERRGRTTEILDFFRELSCEVIPAKDWVEAAQLATRLGDREAAREFCERAFVRSGYSSAVAARVASILLKNDFAAEALATWERVNEDGSGFRGPLGAVRTLAQLRRHEALVSRGARILESAAPVSQLTAAEQGRLVEIARRTAAAAQALFSETGSAARPDFLERAGSDPWTDWLRALFAQARDDSGAALCALEHWRDAGKDSIATVDFNAEAGMVHTQCRRYREASAAFGRAVPELLSSNSYARRYRQVKSVEEFCGEAAFHDYPEALIDILLEEALRAPANYQPRPRTLLTVCGSLGGGGGERQAITILRRLSTEPAVAELKVAVRSTDGAGRAFFLPQLREIPLEPIVYGAEWGRRSAPGESFGDAFPGGRMLQALELLPHSLREEIVRLCRVIFEVRPAAVHIRQDMYGSALACAIAGVPRLFIHRGSLAPDKWAYEPFKSHTQLRPMRYVYRKLLGASPLVIINNSFAGSASDRNWLESQDGSRFKVIYNAMEFEKWAATDAAAAGPDLAIPENAFVIGGVFRLAPVKRPMFWMEVAARVARSCPEAHFLVVGDGEYAAAMRELAAREGFAARLHMPGQMQDVGPWYRAMDLNLLTSEREGLPNVLIEGQHFGVPALAPDVGGVLETLKPDVTGRVLRNDAGADEFAAAALAIWRDQSWRARARRQAPAFVHERFGTDRAARELLECFGFTTNSAPTGSDRSGCDPAHALVLREARGEG